LIHFYKRKMEKSYSSMGLVDPEYVQDIICWLKKQEQCSMEFKRQSPQMDKRRHLVDWTSVVAEKLHLTSCTVHLAIKILDFFMDGHDIQDPQLYLVCLGSLLLASKMEEKDSNVPKCSEMNAFTKNRFPLSDFISLEIVILKYFNWNLCLPTACYFAEMWLPYAIHPTDSHNNGPLVSFRDAKAYFHQYVKYFLDLAMQDSTFIDTLPSVLAASLLAASRSAFGLTPNWTKRMEFVTGYRMDVLQPFTGILLGTFKRDTTEESEMSCEDEGYVSRTSSPVKEYDSLNCSEVMDSEMS